jgi:hypothetical protein
MSRRHAVGDEGAEVAEGSRDIRVEAGECPERDSWCPIKGSVQDLRGPAENPDILSCVMEVPYDLSGSR